VANRLFDVKLRGMIWWPLGHFIFLFVWRLDGHQGVPHNLALNTLVATKVLLTI